MAASPISTPSAAGGSGNDGGAAPPDDEDPSEERGVATAPSYLASPEGHCVFLSADSNDLSSVDPNEVVAAIRATLGLDVSFVEGSRPWSFRVRTSEDARELVCATRTMRLALKPSDWRQLNFSLV